MEATLTLSQATEIIPSHYGLNERVEAALLKNVAESTRRIYANDAQQFSKWLDENGLNIVSLNFEGISGYRAWLANRYQKGTAARKLVVAKRLLDIAVLLELRTDNPAKQVKSFGSSGENETTHRALNKDEAKALLGKVDIATNKGKRDYALIMLLLRTGLRRAETAALTLGDLRQEQGHNIVLVRHGKGDKRRVVKVPVDVVRAIQDYLVATGREVVEPSAPLFVRFKKGDRPKESAVNGLDIERIVESYAQAAGLAGLTPHGLRATFVTLSLEGGAQLQQVQYAAGHSDPRTTERYQRRKTNLDNHAVDYIRLEL